MSTVETLIRLSKLDVDERRRALSDLLDRDAVIDRRIVQLDEELTRERQKARDEPEFAGGFAAYSEAAAGRRQSLVDEKAALAIEIESARDRLAQAYEEQKKYEITAERQEEAAASERNRLDQIVADELGLQSHARKQDQGG